MTKIFFWSPSGFQPLKDTRAYQAESHGWQVGGGVYGVVVPRAGIDPLDLVDVLTAAGVTVLPSVYDSAPLSLSLTNVLVPALGQFGVQVGDTAYTAAAKMYIASQMKPMRPDLY